MHCQEHHIPSTCFPTAHVDASILWVNSAQALNHSHNVKAKRTHQIMQPSIAPRPSSKAHMPTVGSFSGEQGLDGHSDWSVIT